MRSPMRSISRTVPDDKINIYTTLGKTVALNSYLAWVRVRGKDRIRIRVTVTLRVTDMIGIGLD